MRGSRLLVVMLAALGLCACAQRGPQYSYGASPYPGAGYPFPAQAPVYQAPLPPQAYPPAVLQAAPSPAPVYQAAATPQPRGVFTSGGPLARAQAYRAPVYAQPTYQPPPVYQQPAYPAPVYQSPVYAPPPPAAMPGCAVGGCRGSGTGYAAYPAMGFEQSYTLDAGDRLRITVFGQEGLTNSYAVDAAGNITMPLIATVPARGLTTDQLSQSVSERLRQGFIREPHVAIEIEAYRPFFIHGEVANPGQFPYVANMTVENAIAIAGGFGPRADRGKISVSRTIGGQTTKGTVGLNYPLRPGDTLRVQERWF